MGCDDEAAKKGGGNANEILRERFLVRRIGRRIPGK
jgi:hypothetical protein